MQIWFLLFICMSSCRQLRVSLLRKGFKTNRTHKLERDQNRVVVTLPLWFRLDHLLFFSSSRQDKGDRRCQAERGVQAAGGGAEGSQRCQRNGRLPLEPSVARRSPSRCKLTNVPFSCCRGTDARLWLPQRPSLGLFARPSTSWVS